MNGYSRNDALGRISSALLKTRYPNEHDVAYEQVTREGAWEGRLVQTRKDGTEVYADARWALDPQVGTIPKAAWSRGTRGRDGSTSTRSPSLGIVGMVAYAASGPDDAGVVTRPSFTWARVLFPV